MKMKMACNKSDILGSVEPFRTVGSRLVSFMLGRPSCPDSVHGCLLEPRGGGGGSVEEGGRGGNGRADLLFQC